MRPSIPHLGWRLLDLLGKLWASPVTTLGMLYGLSGFLAGHLACRLGWMSHAPVLVPGNNALQFLNNPFTIPRRAITLGNTISYGRGCDPDKQGAYGDPRAQLGRHEKAHTLQYQLLGPLFIPLYLLLGGFSGPAGNPFERAAQRYAAGEGGWWPGCSALR